MKKLLFIIGLSSVIFLAGCAMPLSQEHRKQIHTIKVDVSKTLPPMTIYGNGAQFAQAFGVIGAAAGGSIESRDRFALAVEAKQNRIDFVQMFKNELTTSLTKLTSFKIVNTQPDAILFVKIDDYGLMATKMGLSLTNLSTSLTVTSKLVYRNQIVWTKKTVVTSLNNGVAKGDSIQGILKNPKEFSDMWRTTSKTVANKVAVALNQPA